MAVAQWIERWVADPKDGGSSPSRHALALTNVVQQKGRRACKWLAFFNTGEVSERLKELVSKTSEGVKLSVGSNPTLSALTLGGN